MDKSDSTPRPGEIFYLTKDKPYQIVTLGIHKETCESMVIYQALFGEFKTYVLPLSKFMEEIQENISTEYVVKKSKTDIIIPKQTHSNDKQDASKESVNQVLLDFLDEDSYSNKLEIITAHINEFDDRLIDNMAASLDCTIDDGPVEDRLQGLIYCLKQLSHFEVRRLR